MKKMALFLGAGASVPYGMPTTKGFLDKLDDNFPRHDLLGHAKYTDVEYILVILDKTIDFARQEAGKYQCKRDGEFKEIAERSKDAKKTIDRMIRSYYKWTRPSNRAAEGILAPLIDLVKYGGQHVTIFTTNYDTAVENYCANAGRKIDRIDGFKYNKSARLNIWEDNFTSNDDTLPIKVHLYKLHGSMSWQKDEVGGKTVIVQKPDGSTPDRRSKDMYIRPSLDVKRKATRADPYRAIFRRFKKHLRSFDACIVIGYSFRDKHIRGEFLEFIRHGGLLIAISPTAAADFWASVKGQPLSREMVEWGRKPLCCMSYRPGNKARFYAVHQRLGENDMDTLVDTITGIIDNKRSADNIGSIVGAAD